MRLCASLVVSLLLPLAEAAWVPCNVAACECAGYCLDSLRGKSYTLSSADQKEQCVLRSRRLSLSLSRARALAQSCHRRGISPRELLAGAGMR